MRQGFKQEHAADTMVIGLTTDFHDNSGEEIWPGKTTTESLMPGEGKRITRLLGR